MKYTIKIKEILEKVVTVEANDSIAALEYIEEKTNDGTILLDDNNFIERYISNISNQKINFSNAELQNVPVTLYDYLMMMEEHTELTVWDCDYDIEIYFYNEVDKTDKWQTLMLEFAKLLTVVDSEQHGVTVNLSQVIHNHIKQLDNANLFIKCNVDTIMEEMDYIMSGYVSLLWLQKFINTLQENN